MRIIFLSLVILSLTYAVENGERLEENSGQLTVNSNPIGLKIYLEGDFIGITPIQNYKLASGKYSVSLFASDTIEEKYWQLANAGFSGKLFALWELTKAGTGTQQIEIKPNQVSELFFSLKKVNRAPARAKWTATCCVGTGFSFAFILGYLVANWIK